MANTVKFFTGTQQSYNGLAEKDTNAIYFIEDTGKIYKGNKDLTSDVTLMDAVPGTLNANKVAIVKVTANETTVYDVYVGDAGNKPVKVIPGNVSDASAFENDSTFGSYTATVSAIKTFVNNAIATTTTNANKAVINATFDKAQGTLTFDKASESEADTVVNLEGIAHGIVWNSETFQLTIPMYGEEADVEINIPKDFFLQDGKYVADYEFTQEPEEPEGEPTTYHSPAILLTVNIQDGEEGTQKVIAIPVKDLVDTYTVESTDTVTLTLSNNNIKAEVKFDTTTVQTGDEHILVKTATGIAETTKSLNDINSDIETAVNEAVEYVKANLVGEGDADKVIISTATGVTRSTAGIGGATLAGTPNATTLATEAAVNTAIDSKIETALTWNTIQ